jgi:hypothetical protein
MVYPIVGNLRYNTNMIAFDLICSNGHKFECWFKNNDSFEQQKTGGVINCPVCNDNNIEKALSTFGIKKYVENKEGNKGEENQIDSYHILKKISEYVDKNFEDVGLNFTREALKIHYGEAEKRNIKGMALPNEEKVLKEEGVQFFKIPILKRLDN